MWQVVVGGFGNSGRLSNIELFPRPSSAACSIPDLPQSIYGHSLSLLSGGRLVVCGGHNGSTSSLLDSCNSWVAGNNSWTPLYTMRCRQEPLKIIFMNTITVWGDIITRPGRRNLFQTPSYCWADLALEQDKLPRLYQVFRQR